MTGNRLALAAAVVAAIMLAILIAFAVADLRAVAAAWLYAFLLLVGAPVGALTLRLIGRLTGGLWAETLEPTLGPLSMLAPVAALAAVAVLATAPDLYPWAAGHAGDPAVGAYYLNMPLFVLRTVIAFAGWTVLAFDILPTEGRRGQVVAGLGLVFHVVITTFIAYDWVLAMTPHFTSSDFATENIIMWMLSALALAALLTPVSVAKVSYDVAGLMIALIMGAAYMVFMQFLIVWYGDVPDTAKFYVERFNGLGVWLMVATFVVGLIIPMFSLAFEPVRGNIGRLRVVAVFALVGVALQRAWLVLPVSGALAAYLAPAAILFILSLFTIAWPWTSRPRRGLRREAERG